MLIFFNCIIILNSASSSVATEWLKGKSVDDCLSIKVSGLEGHHILSLTISFSSCSQNTDIAAHLKLPPVKLHCSMLAEDAIKAAIKDYKSKNPMVTVTAAAAK